MTTASYCSMMWAIVGNQRGEKGGGVLKRRLVGGISIDIRLTVFHELGGMYPTRGAHRERKWGYIPRPAGEAGVQSHGGRWGDGRPRGGRRE